MSNNMRFVCFIVFLITLVTVCTGRRNNLDRVLQQSWRTNRLRGQQRQHNRHSNMRPFRGRGRHGKFDLGPRPHEHYKFLKHRAKIEHEYLPKLEKMREDWYDPAAPHVNIQGKLTRQDKQFWEGLCKHKRRRWGRRGKRQTTTPQTIRKEYRRLTSTERTAFHNAVNQIKVRTIGGVAEYDIIAGQHEANVATNAHFGPGFPLWHRVYLKIFENALKGVDNSVALPYWDSSCENSLGNGFQDSAMFTFDGVGNWDGPVTTGPFANFPVVNGCANIGTSLTRSVNANGILYDYAEIRNVENGYTDYSSIMTNIGGQGWRSKFESDHGNVHVTVGGHVGSLSCSPSDPLFFMHHGFVDYLFERLILKHTTPFDTANYDATNVANHGLDQTAQPFNETFRDVFRKDYLSLSNVKYEDSPCRMSCTTDADCNGDMLWCSSTLDRCVARKRQGSTPVNGTASSCHCGNPQSPFPVITNNRCDCSATAAPSTTTTTPQTTTTDAPDYYDYYGDWWDRQNTWNNWWWGK